LICKSILEFAVCDPQITDFPTSREFSAFAKPCSRLHASPAAPLHASSGRFDIFA
jgi:hypothetical protein